MEPLAAFYRSLNRQPPVFRTLAPDQLPQPARDLLVHDRDMTGTLAQFHRQPIHLRVLEKRLNGDELTRRVVLVRADSGAIVEYGASRTRLSVLGDEARRAVLEGHTPLGGVLTQFKIAFVSSPSAYFEVDADESIREAMTPQSATRLYGRCNALTAQDGREISAVVEILPP